MSECAFCLIASGDLKADLVYEDAQFLAFLDLRPVFHGHTLVIPRAHVETLPDADDQVIAELFVRVKQITTGVTNGLGAQGSFVAVNNKISQSVPHLHVHVIPRTEGDGLRGFFWPRTTYDDATHSASIAARIAAALPA